MFWYGGVQLLIALGASQCNASVEPVWNYGLDKGILQSRQDYPGHVSCGHTDYPKQCGENWDYTDFPKSQSERAEAVIEMFRFAWNAYYKHAVSCTPTSDFD